MKIALKTLLLLIVCLCQTGPLLAQANVKSQDSQYYGLMPYEGNFIKRINNDLFMLFSQPSKDEKALVGYDSNLNKVFNIGLEPNSAAYSMYARDRFYPSFAYNQEANHILLIETLTPKADIVIRARTFDTAGKLLKKGEFKQEGKITDLDKVEISENGKYFSVSQKVGKKNRDLKVTLYDSSLQELYSKTIQAKDKETILLYSISSGGNLTLVSSLADDRLEVKRFDPKGAVEHAFTFKKNVSGKERYQDYLLKSDGQRVLLAAEKKFSSSFMGIDIFDMNFSTKHMEKYSSIEFNTENIAKMYGRANEDHILNKNNSLISSSHKTPKHLEDITIKHLLIENDDVIVVSESQSTITHTGANGRYFYSTYNAGDILISSFTGPKNNWNSIIGRRVSEKVDGLGGWAALSTSVYLDKGKLQVITSEYKKGDGKNHLLYLRKVDQQTGNVAAPQILVDHYYWSNTGFITWLTPEKIAIFRTSNMNIAKKGYTLNLVQTDDRTVQ